MAHRLLNYAVYFLLSPPCSEQTFHPLYVEAWTAGFFFEVGGGGGGADFNLIWPQTKAYLYAEHLYVICFGFAGKLGISRNLPRLSYSAQPSSLNTCSNDKNRLSVKIVQL